MANANKFFNTLTNRPISSEDYQHAENVWRKLGFVNLGQYCEMYLILDILILGRTMRRSVAIRFLVLKKDDENFFLSFSGYLERFSKIESGILRTGCAQIHHPSIL